MQAGLFGDEKQSENEVEAELIEFMQSERWRPTRNHVGLFRTSYGARIKIGINNFPDWTFTRGSGGVVGVAELCHVEAKRTGAKPNKGQLEVIASLNHLGELATWTNDMVNYKKWYRTHFNN